MDLTFLDPIGGAQTVAIAAAVVVGLWVLKVLFGRPAPSAHHTERRCPACGWRGTVSKYKPVCPKCARSLAAG